MTKTFKDFWIAFKAGLDVFTSEKCNNTLSPKASKKTFYILRGLEAGDNLKVKAKKFFGKR